MRRAEGFGDAVATPHAASTDAANQIFAEGGNAVDAAIAANAVQGVVAPETCGVGGDLFALIYRPGDARAAALNASGRAGSKVDPAELSDESRIPFDHPLSVTVPGCVDGWVALADRFATKSLATLLQPAIELAAGGFEVSPELARALVRRRLDASEFYPDGTPAAAGATVRRPRLAAVLQAVADRGRDGFYAGAAGRAIIEAVDGRITEADLARRQADWVEPLGAEVFGRTGWTIPPNSQGYLALASGWIFEQLQPPRRADDPDYLHLQIEAYRSVAWERDDVVADLDFAPLPPNDLVAPDRLRARVEAVDPARAGRWPSPEEAPGGTAYLCTADTDGMGVSLIQSNYTGFGSGIGAAGFFLQNRGAGFTLAPGHPNRLAPGKRPLHTLAPTLWTVDGRLDTLLGTRGGAYQPQLLLQMAAAVFLLGLDPAEAQSLSRWTLEEFGPSAPSAVLAEPGLPALDELEGRGHRVQRLDGLQPGWGPVSIIRRSPEGRYVAAADPRVETTSATVG